MVYRWMELDWEIWGGGDSWWGEVGLWGGVIRNVWSGF